ncbi:PIN domain-containing protein [Amycolatopsis taiwanensis]|uniref:PIN domain-containing protein n=1 Tax=Amycolatopsis taiwanensis TaxID=342230 RepID=UPI00069370B6
MARASSRLLRIELLRAVARNGAHRMPRAHVILSGVVLLSMDDAAPTAEVIGDSYLRSLDAIHLATAHAVRSALTALVTYDKRMVEGATALGLPVASPA